MKDFKAIFTGGTLELTVDIKAKDRAEATRIASEMHPDLHLENVIEVKSFSELLRQRS